MLERAGVLVVVAASLVACAGPDGSADSACPENAACPAAEPDWTQVDLGADAGTAVACPPGRAVLPSPAIDWEEVAPRYDTVEAAVAWFTEAAWDGFLAVSPESATPRFDLTHRAEVVRSPDDLTTVHWYVPIVVDGAAQIVLGVTDDGGLGGLVVNEVWACEGVGR